MKGRVIFFAAGRIWTAVVVIQRQLSFDSNPITQMSSRTGHHHPKHLLAENRCSYGKQTVSEAPFRQTLTLILNSPPSFMVSIDVISRVTWPINVQRTYILILNSLLAHHKIEMYAECSAIQSSLWCSWKLTIQALSTSRLTMVLPSVMGKCFSGWISQIDHLTKSRTSAHHTKRQ